MSESDPTFGQEAKFAGPLPKRSIFSRYFVIICGLLSLLLLFGMALGPIGHGRGFSYKIDRLQQARNIGSLMFEYATDHYADGNSYPDGNSSTEVFQKLIDGGYCKDPTIFYVPLRGKVEPVIGQKLKPENVCWDVTSGVTPNAPNGLPLVFMTGYQVTYASGADAIPLIKPYPPYGSDSWLEWLLAPRSTGERLPVPGIAVFYMGNRASFVRLSPLVNPDGSISDPPHYQPDGSIANFIPTHFDPKGKTYRQLTPDGPLLEK